MLSSTTSVLLYFTLISVEMWCTLFIHLIIKRSFEVPTKLFLLFATDIRRCQPAMWKAIVCTMHIKPCYNDPRINRLCRCVINNDSNANKNSNEVVDIFSFKFVCISRSDCVRLLSKCVDRSRTMSATVVDDVCQLVAVDDTVQSCMSLGPYLGKIFLLQSTLATHITNSFTMYLICCG